MERTLTSDSIGDIKQIVIRIFSHRWILGVVLLGASAVLMIVGLNAREKHLRFSAEKTLMDSLYLNDQLNEELSGALVEKHGIQNELDDTKTEVLKLQERMNRLQEELTRVKLEAEETQLKYWTALRAKRQLIGEIKKRNQRIAQIRFEMNRVFKDQSLGLVNLGSLTLSKSDFSSIAVARHPKETLSKKPLRREQAAGPDPREHVGEVIAVNEEYEFVVINLGRKHGIEDGMRFSVIRDQNTIGTAKIEMIQETMSAAAHIPIAGNKIQIGDQVRIL